MSEGGAWTEVCTCDEIPRGEGRAFEVLGRQIAVFNDHGKYYAIDDQCPHMGASLATGYLENCAVACPWHAWRFDIRDGTWCDNPKIKIDSFAVSIENNRVMVCVPPKQNTAHRPAADTACSVANAPGAAEDAASLAPRQVGGNCAAGPEGVSGETNDESQMTPGCSAVAGAQVDAAQPSSAAVNLRDFQQLIRQMYYEKDRARGVEGTFMWLMEEVGELSSALRDRDHENRIEEFADVLAWLATIANVCEIDLSAAIQKKYGTGCPGCRQFVCCCPDSEKP